MFHFIQMFGFHDSWSHLYPAMISCWFYPLNIPQICLSSSFHYCHPSPTRLASTVCVDYRMSPLTDVPVPFLGILSSVLPKTPERSVSKPKSIYSTLLLKALQWLSIAYKIIRLLTMTYGVLSGLPWPTLQPPPPLTTRAAVPEEGHDSTYPLAFAYAVPRVFPVPVLPVDLSLSVTFSLSGAGTFIKGHCGTKFCSFLVFICMTIDHKRVPAPWLLWFTVIIPVPGPWWVLDECLLNILE